MSWLGLRHKGVEVLYPREWNAVVDGLDFLKQYTDASLRKEELSHLDMDIIPDYDFRRKLGDPSRYWLAIYTHYAYVEDKAFIEKLYSVSGYFDQELYLEGKPVLKDGDPVITKEFIDLAKEDIERIYNLLSETKKVVDQIYEIVRQPESLRTVPISVSTTPLSLSDVGDRVKRLHIKVPSWAMYLVYVGSSDRQDFVLEPGDKEVLEVSKPSNVYVRSLGNVTIYVMVES